MARSIQSIDVPLELSLDGGTTWKDLICLESVDLPTERSPTETVTYCGRKSGLRL